MKSWLMFALLLLLSCMTLAQTTRDYEGFLKAFPNANITKLYELPNLDPVPLAHIPRFTFTCPQLAAPEPTNDVNNLKPGHIQVIMAMGDSITAGMGAKDTWLWSLDEYRGNVYSIGEESGIVTLTNIIKFYNPNVYGGSSGIGDRNMKTTGFNAAVSGAVNNDLMGQAEWLVAKLKADTRVDMANHWKLLTIWIGSNNLCDVCENQAANDGANFQTNLVKVLDYLKANVPRLFVNVIGNMDVAGLYNLDGGLGCSAIHLIACPCAGTPMADNRNIATKAQQDYVERAYSIANMYKGYTDFAVVVQPFLTQNAITDRSLLSAADCFHPSAKGHVLGAVALWNNMLAPRASKKTVWQGADVPNCPDANSKFPTD